MKSNINIFLLIFTLIAVSCGPSQEDRARIILNKANVFLQNGDTTNALLNIDSISILFPKAVYSINASKNLKDEIYWDLLQKNENELDSTLIIIKDLENNFIKEKTDFDKYIQYIHRRQKFDNRWSKSYLKIHLDERGEIYFSSNYYGEKQLNHTGIRVYDGPNQAKTEKVELGNVNNHQSDFLEGKWEKVTFRKGKEANVIEFIAKNTDLNLKAVFLGTDYYYIILEEYDKRAFRDAFALSQNIKKRKSLEEKIKKLQSGLNIVDNK